MWQVRLSALGGLMLFASGFVAGIVATSQYLQLQLTWPGVLNLVAAVALLSWYLLDTALPRRTVYSLWGIEEQPLRPGLRLGRRVALLTSAIVSIAACLVALTPVQPGNGATIPPAALQSVVVLTAAYLATLGWMYTAFEKEKTDRAGQTLTAIREQLSGDYVRELYSQILALSEYYRQRESLDKEQPLPKAAMACTLAALPPCDRPDGRPSTSLGGAVDRFLNALDHIAFGVRQGQFDFRSIEMVLRQRFVRTAFLFSDYIRDETSAVDIPGTGWRSTSRTWEHYLWLVSCLQSLPSDKVDRRVMVLPPSRIVSPDRASSPARSDPLVPTGEQAVAPDAQLR